MTTPRGELRVTVLLNALHGGGAEHVGRTWVRQLVSLGVPCRLVVLERPSEATIESVGLDLPLYVVDRRAGWRSWWALRRLLDRNESRHRARHADVGEPGCDLRDSNASSLPPASGCDQRAQYRQHPRRVTFGEAPPQARGARRSYRRADRMVAISHPVAAEMVAAFRVSAQRCTVVPNPAASKGHESRGVRPPREIMSVTLVVVGRLVAQKRPLLVVPVAEHLARAGIETRVLVVGDGQLDRQSKSRAGTRRCRST